MTQSSDDNLEKKIIKHFDSVLRKPCFEQIFNVNLGSDFTVSYNSSYSNAEFDIVLYGQKRLSIGLLINSPYNIEIQTNKCTKNIINKKYHDGLLSMILTNGLSNNSNRTRKVYSFTDYKRDSFTPCFLDNYCEKISKMIRKDNVAELEKILYSSIDSNLKKGLLYYLCDKLVAKEFKKIFFIPNLMQVSLISKNVVNNCVIDSGFSRQKITNYSLSKSYEQYLNAKFNKKFSKSVDSKNFSLITQDSDYSNFCNNSEISQAILVKENILELGLNGYIKQIKKL